VAVILSLIPLILTINLIFMGQKNQSLQAQLQAQQEQINTGSRIQQVGMSVLKDIAAASVKDDKLKDVLAKNGYSVTVNSPSPSPEPATSPTP
jgi:predicted Holliday junction resolvase-like endonuclease